MFNQTQRLMASFLFVVLVGIALIASARAVLANSDNHANRGNEATNSSSTQTPIPVSASPEVTSEENCDACEVQAEQIQALSTLTAKRRQQKQEEAVAVVQTVLFWMEGCPHCHDVMEDVLPPLKRKYGDSLEIMLVRVDTQAQVNALFKLADSLGIAKERVGVPFLMIGEDVLIGSVEIPERLPSLVDAYIDAGGAPLPGAPGLESLMQSGSLNTIALREEVPSNPNGYGLSIAVLAGMAAIFVYGLWVLLRRDYGALVWLPSQGWTNYFPLLVAIGFGVAAYLSYVETQNAVAVCGPVGDCNRVQQSEYAVVFGIPVGVLGLFGYVLMIATWWIDRKFPGTRPGRWAPLALLALTTSGLVFSIYLTYLEPFVIGAVCLWCLASSVIIALLFLLSLSLFVNRASFKS